MNVAGFSQTHALTRIVCMAVILADVSSENRSKLMLAGFHTRPDSVKSQRSACFKMSLQAATHLMFRRRLAITVRDASAVVVFFKRARQSCNLGLLG